MGRKERIGKAKDDQPEGGLTRRMMPESGRRGGGSLSALLDEIDVDGMEEDGPVTETRFVEDPGLHHRETMVLDATRLHTDETMAVDVLRAEVAAAETRAVDVMVSGKVEDTAVIGER